VSRTLIVETREGRRRVSGIPDDAKVTFGPIQPGKGGPVYVGDAAGNALRIYTSASNQLAVFVGVVSFRDESLSVEREVTETAREATSSHGPSGSYADERVEIETRWEPDN
jgi:hypothetical protein